MKSTPLYILRLALTLLLVTAFVAGALAGVNMITRDRITAIQAEKTQQAIAAVLPGGGEKLAGFTDTTGLVKAVYASAAGYAVQVAPAGFDGAIDMMVGVGTDGTVLKIAIIDPTETAGLGAVAAANTSKGEAFRGQFEGLTGSLSVDKDGGTIDALTGATVTSRAVTRGVNAAIACVKAFG